MKILVDIIHPANVHYFKNFIFYMKSKGHEIIITARRKDVSHKLLDSYKLSYYSTGKGSFGKGAIGKFLYILYAEIYFFLFFLKHKPKLAISFSSTPVSHNSYLFRIPHISFDDTEHAKLNRLLYLPTTTKVFTPSCFTLDLGKKHTKIETYMELFYLHPNVFQPNKNIFEILGLQENDPYIILRFISWQAFHDIGENGISEEEKILLVKELEKYGKVFISSEGELPEDLSKHQIRIPVDKMHDVLAFSAMYFGDGGTTASEAAVLGVPSILISSSTTGYLTEEEEKYDLLYRFTGEEGTFDMALKRAKEILEDVNVKQKWREKRNKMLKEKIDGTSYFIKYVEKEYLTK